MTSTAEDDPQANDDSRRRFERELLEATNRSREEAYRAGFYNGFVEGFPCGFREAVRDKSVPLMRAGWDQVPDEVIETGRSYCQLAMTVLHMAAEPGWTRFPLEKFWEKAELSKASTSSSG